MKVIVMTDVYGLGEEGDIVTTSGGYARNYLIPQGKAVEYSAQNLSMLKDKYAAIQRRKEEKQMQQTSLKEGLDSKTITIRAKTNDKGQLYGAVTQAMIASALAEEGIDIDKRQILVEEHSLKAIGTYDILVKFNQELDAKLTIQVESENYADLRPVLTKHAEEELPGTMSGETDSVEKEVDSEISETDPEKERIENSADEPSTAASTEE